MEEKNVLDYDGLSKFKEMIDQSLPTNEDVEELQTQIDALKENSGGITAKIVRW